MSEFTDEPWLTVSRDRLTVDMRIEQMEFVTRRICNAPSFEEKLRWQQVMIDALDDFDLAARGPVRRD